MNEQKKITLANLQQLVEGWVHNCKLNHKDPSEVEFIIRDSTERKDYRPFSGFLSWGSHGTKACIEFFHSDVITFDPKDERPAVGEYWKSRGASTFDVSGFITSKAAGLRLMRMVRYILDTDEPKTWLDYRKYEPNWIQLKFSAEEFDVEKLDASSRANGGVITEQILRDCVKAKKVEYSAEDKAAELMARMAEDVKDASLKVEDIVDRYVKTATPELRQQLIDKLTEIRKEKFGIE